jgi:hypothetical protein
MRNRNFARPEAFQAHLILQFIELGAQALVQLVGGNDDFQLALQAFGQGFCDLHETSNFRKFVPVA